MKEQAKPHSRRMMFGCLGLLVGFILALWWFVGPALTVASGYIEPQTKRQWQGTSMENLKAIHTALSLYQESEGALPPADRWMDAIATRLKTADLTTEEAEKKLRSPSVARDNPLAFGYAFMAELEGKYMADIENPAQTPLVFDSRDLTRNAHGDPVQLKPDPPRPEGNLTVTVDGQVVRLDSLLSK